jgi:hypothetical protein
MLSGQLSGICCPKTILTEVIKLLFFLLELFIVLSKISFFTVSPRAGDSWQRKPEMSNFGVQRHIGFHSGKGQYGKTVEGRL